MGFLSYLDVNWIAHESFTVIGILGAFCVLLGAVITILFSRTRKKNRFSN
jgi:drug/metabolite transporter (DMT)-like permease